VIGQRKRRLAQLGRALRHRARAAHAVEQGVFGVHVEVNEGVYMLSPSKIASSFRTPGSTLTQIIAEQAAER